MDGCTYVSIDVRMKISACALTLYASVLLKHIEGSKV